jgi:S-DNA-T family DNA segregation ATPase FtsK/SpoIIIE
MSTADRPRLSLVPLRDADDAPDLPDDRHDELDTRPDQELDQVVYEGEILSDRPVRTSLLPAVVVDRVMVVRSPEKRAKAAKTVARGGVTVAQGWHSWLVRAYDALTFGVYRRQIRAAEAAGDREALADWTERKARAVAERRTRLMELPQLALNVARFLGISLLGALVLLLALSIAVWATGVGSFGAVWELAGGLLRLILTVLKWAWPAAPLAMLWAAWREGNRRTASASWSTAPGSAGRGDARGVLPNEGAIFKALQNLGESKLNRAIKAGWQPRFVMPTTRDGNGWRTQLELPQGVTVDMIIDKKKVLAHNLVRFPVEVWPTEPRTQPGVMDLWVADQGSLTGKVPDWPLLEKGSADYFAGVPCAVDIRGKVIKGLLSEKNYSFAGTMGSGKSTMIITILCGAMLDPLTEIEVFVLAENADYKPMRPRLRTLVTGPGTEVVKACLAAMRDLYEDLVIRGRALQEYGDDVRQVTRELAEKDERLRPRILVIDECQALFMHQDLGEEAEDLAIKLMSAARKYGVTLMFATPQPSTDSLPRQLMTVITNKTCFAIGDHTSNDAALGTGSYKAGISAVGLEPKTEESNGDIGTCMARGFQPKPGLLRSFYVNGSQVAAVTARALKIRQDAGIGPARVVVEAPRDLLEDLAAVMGAEPIKAAKLPALLARHASAWLPYKSLTGKQLVEDLAELGVKVPSTGNQWFVNPEDVRAALVRRESDDGEAG